MRYKKQTGKSGVTPLAAAMAVMASVMLAACFLFPLKAHAAYTVPASGDGWEIDADGHMTVTGRETLKDWYPGSDSYERYKSLVTSVDILESANITSLGGIFQGCENLTRVNLPNGLERIAETAFAECVSLAEITIPETVTKIENRAFFGCSSLTGISLPDGVTKIEDMTFWGCSSLTSVKLPASVTSIGYRAFDTCRKLESIELPSGLQKIGEDAFNACSSLASIVIPSGVTSIGSQAFQSCSSLGTVTLLAEEPPEIGSYVFRAVIAILYSEKIIYVPKGTAKAYQQAWSEYKFNIYVADDMAVDPTAEDYEDTAIDVKGHTKAAVVYSVDVEWGAMTFVYENKTWDAVNHQAIPGGGWKVYDSVNNKALDSETDSINRIAVTNHSNADVWARLAYAGEAGYTDTSGRFLKKADDTATSYDAVKSCLVLGTADNGENGAAGKPTAGVLYFMPTGIKEEYKTDGFGKWQRLGTITVGILTQAP